MSDEQRLAGILALVFSCGVCAAATDDKAEYERRAAARYAELFHALDRNGDSFVTREEARGDLNFVPRFDDMDVNRDAVVTLKELENYIAQEYGLPLPLR